MRTINEIVVHATATPADWRPDDTTSGRVASVRSWHVDGRGWSDIGYHYLIDRDGTIAEGRPVHRAGAHVSGRNANTIGISLFGGQGGSTHDDFYDHFTKEQDKALRVLISELQDKYGPNLHLSGHSEYANKACPCFQVREWYEEGLADNTDGEDNRLLQSMKKISGTVTDTLKTGYSHDLPLPVAKKRWTLASIRNSLREYF